MTRSHLGRIARVVLELQEKRPNARIKVRGADGTFIELDGREIKQAIKDSRSPPTALDKLAFSEAYQYIENAKSRYAAKSAVGYSDCKANYRSALISALKTLTGKDKTREAVKELGRQRMLGDREEEFIDSFGDFLITLHSLASKKGAHPPLTTEAKDAELVLSVTTSILNYVTNQAVKRTG